MDQNNIDEIVPFVIFIDVRSRIAVASFNVRWLQRDGLVGWRLENHPNIFKLRIQALLTIIDTQNSIKIENFLCFAGLDHVTSLIIFFDLLLMVH